jgi:hypothetical protein
MAIEDRIKALEDESKVLKNVIQATLLDIQKEILTHYYALEVEDREVSAGDAGWERDQNTRPVHERGVSPGQADEEADESARLSTQDAISRPGLSKQGRGRSCLQDREVWATVARLLIWLSESVSDIGRERIAKSIKMYGAFGYISPEMQKVLMALIAFSREGDHPEHLSIKQLLEKLAELSNILNDGGQPVNLNHILALVEELERQK